MGHMCASTKDGRGERASVRPSAYSKRRPRPTRVPLRNSRTLQFPGSAPSTARSASTTTSSLSEASARIFATVAPRTGLAGSTSCVTKIALTPPSRAPPALVRRAKSPGVATQRAASRRAPSPRRSASSRSEARRTDIAERRRIAGRHRMPFSSSTTMSGTPRSCAHDARRPRQNGSTTIRGKPSERAGAAGGRLVHRGCDLGGREALVSTHALGELRHESLGNLAQRSSPDDVERRGGQPRRRGSPCLGQHLDGLVALEHADEEEGQARRAGAPRAARGRSPGP